MLPGGDELNWRELKDVQDCWRSEAHEPKDKHQQVYHKHQQTWHRSANAHTDATARTPKVWDPANPATWRENRRQNPNNHRGNHKTGNREEKRSAKDRRVSQNCHQITDNLSQLQLIHACMHPYIIIHPPILASIHPVGGHR